MRRISVLIVMTLALASAAPTFAEAPGSAGAKIASAFADRFLAGDHKTNLQRMTAEMVAGFSPEQAEPLRANLVEQFGELQRIGDCRQEDTQQDYRRYRVPVEFERETVDLRIVLDSSDRIAGLFIVPHVAPAAAQPAAAGSHREIEVTVGDDSSGLPGTLTLPGGSGPFPGVVLVHGSGPNDRDETIGPNKPFRDLAWGLATHGIAVLRYDKRSRVQPLGLLNLGGALTVREETIDDARIALELLRRRDEVDATRTFVLGHSLGGTAAPRIAETDPQPAGLVVLAGMTLPMHEKMLTQTRYIVMSDGELSADEKAYLESTEKAVATVTAALDGSGSDPEGYILGVPIGYHRDLARNDPAAKAASLELPVLVLQGARDYQVTLEDFQRWQSALQGKPFACLKQYDDLDHLFRSGTGPSTPQDYQRQAPVSERVIDDIAGWILNRRCSKAPS